MGGGGCWAEKKEVKFHLKLNKNDKSYTWIHEIKHVNEEPTEFEYT